MPVLIGQRFLSSTFQTVLGDERQLEVLGEGAQLRGKEAWNATVLAAQRLREVEAIYDDGDGRTEGDFKLFRKDDALEWAIFTSVFVLLLCFDHFVLHGKNKRMSFMKACLCTVFWIACAAGFNLYIYLHFGEASALVWTTGYLLEWMLSVDNLFVFHLVFQLYGTPDDFKHKPLFFGILGAIFFRMLFFVVEEYLFHSIWWMHLVFGAFLVYTGIRSVVNSDDDEGDPTKNPLVVWLAKKIPLLPGYDVDGRFFVRVPNDAMMQTLSKESSRVHHVDSSTLSKTASENERYTWKATMLVIVVVCLEVTDIVFAVDSVSTIVAQISDLYLAYTACVFAMLGLRATYFVVDELIRMFSLLKYGVAFILVFIGVKLIAGRLLHVSPGVVLLILTSTLSVCMAGSLLMDRWRRQMDDNDLDRWRVQLEHQNHLTREAGTGAVPDAVVAEPT
mmetsp:Transcript_17430/g.38157  ORF Transcript_17430/g.38157 Transcript_17430/m.38157 type:complete len:448 (-) Transcript_17430:39-1382(-)